jgi:cytochrome c556
MRIRGEEIVMRKWIVLGAVALVVSSLAYRASQAGAEPETPTIKHVMNKLHKGANSPLSQLKGELAAPSPDWEKIQKTTKDFVILGAALAKNDPPKGDKESWKTLSDHYFAEAKVLDDAAHAKDQAAAQAAQKKLSASCKACHTPHKGK